MSEISKLTFCIPYYGKVQYNTEVLYTCVLNIRKYYPKNEILICKNKNSLMPDLSEFDNVNVYDTFIVDSHILGAIQLLITQCKTSNFIICHDSMFMLKELPSSILNIDYYSLWYFKNNLCVEKFLIRIFEEHFPSKKDKLNSILSKYDTLFSGLFGPAFGGNMTMLNALWEVLDINPNNIHVDLLGRIGLEVCERLIPLIVTYIGYDSNVSLNDNIFNQPGAFIINKIPDFNTLVYDGYFYKI